MTNSGLRRGLAVRCGVLASGSRCRAFLPGLPGRTRVRRGSARRYRSLPEKQKGRVADAIRPRNIVAKLSFCLQQVFFEVTERSKTRVWRRIGPPEPSKKGKKTQTEVCATRKTASRAPQARGSGVKPLLHECGRQRCCAPTGNTTANNTQSAGTARVCAH